MAFALLIVGAVLLISGLRNTQGDLYTLIKGDFTGQGNFIIWIVSIIVIGALGYIPSLKPLSRIFLALVLVVLFIHNRGVFAQLNKQLLGAEPPQQSTTAQTNTAQS